MPPYAVNGNLTAFPQRGEIWLMLITLFNSEDPHLPRPALVISPNNRNRAWNSVIVVPLSTGLQNVNLKFHKLIPAGEAGIARESYARCDLVSNLEKKYLDNEQGALGAKLADKYMWEVVRGVRASIGDNPE
jgi:mRNA interferase MazF